MTVYSHGNYVPGILVLFLLFARIVPYYSITTRNLAVKDNICCHLKGTWHLNSSEICSSSTSRSSTKPIHHDEQKLQMQIKPISWVLPLSSIVLDTLDNVLTHARNFLRARKIKAKRWFKCRISYYSNSDSTFNLQALVTQLSGDVHPLPGPLHNSTSEDTDKCPVCSKTLASNHRAICCDSCDSWCHIKCGNVKPSLYKQLQALENFDWSCPTCLHGNLNINNNTTTSTRSNAPSAVTGDRHKVKCMVANARSLKNNILDFQTSVYAGHCGYY